VQRTGDDPAHRRIVAHVQMPGAVDGHQRGGHPIQLADVALQGAGAFIALRFVETDRHRGGLHPRGGHGAMAEQRGQTVRQAADLGFQRQRRQAFLGKGQRFARGHGGHGGGKDHAHRHQQGQQGKDQAAGPAAALAGGIEENGAWHDRCFPNCKG
jgi:hypothetical protein